MSQFAATVSMEEDAATNEVTAMYFAFTEHRGDVAETKELRPGVHLDYDKRGRLLGIEILGPFEKA